MGPSTRSLVLACAMLACGSAARAQDADAQSAEALVKQLSNPVAGLVSVPFQDNPDFVGPRATA